MNKHYVLPICFAAAAHGALLFGFTKLPRPLSSPVEKSILTPFIIPPLEEERPALVDTDRTESPAKNPPDVPQPRLPEPPVLEVDSRNLPTMTPPPISRIDAKDVKTILGPGAGVPGIGDAPWDEGVLSNVAFLDNSPRTRFQAAPVYPFEAKSTGTAGEVHVDFTVDERGRVIEPRVVRSSNRLFDEPTLRAVAKWQFEPGRRHGKIVKFRMMVPVVFNLNEDR